jgi:hypothetical protein
MMAKELRMMLTCCFFRIGGSVTGAISVSLLQFSIDYDERPAKETDGNGTMAHDGLQHVDGSSREKQKQFVKNKQKKKKKKRMWQGTAIGRGITIKGPRRNYDIEGHWRKESTRLLTHDTQVVPSRRASSPSDSPPTDRTPLPVPLTMPSSTPSAAPSLRSSTGCPLCWPVTTC